MYIPFDQATLEDATFSFGNDDLIFQEGDQ